MAESLSQKNFGLPSRYRNQKTSVWDIYTQLDLDYSPLNLGQGCPDFAAPQHIANALSKVAVDSDADLNQYARGYGHVRLVNALGKVYSRLLDRPLNPLTEILVTTGAYGALYSAILGHVDQGDEVIVIEPYFDCYEPMILAAGGVPKFIPLRAVSVPEGEQPTASQWKLDPKELAEAFNEKTKAIIVNTPHNPLGKVFSREELQEIADHCKKWDVLCISDEVYEWLVYEPNEHVRIATLPGMWDRTITVGSGGKTFSITGWKVGWAYGPAGLLYNLQIIHQNSVSSCSTPLQEAIAIGFETELERLDSDDCYFKVLRKEMQKKKDFLAESLKKAGLKPIMPEGGYFILADWSSWENKVDLSKEDDEQRDYRFTKWLTKNVGVQGIPPTAFYSQPNKHLAEDFVRFCFIKKDEKLKAAGQTLVKWYQQYQEKQ